ncbi:MAG: SEC-C metal-binding domain-containing protein [Treponema sp.]
MARVFKVRIQLSPEALEARRLAAVRAQKNMSAQHSEAQEAFGETQAHRMANSAMNADMARRDASRGAMQRRTQGENITVRRSSPKVGRNDPCPCGSGKKYKNCCGRNG